MKPLILLSTLFIFSSCSTTLKNFFKSDDIATKRNEKLMKEDFKVEEDVLNQFKENIKKTKPIEVITNKTNNKITKKSPTKITEKKVENKRRAIRPKPKKLKKATFKAVKSKSIYREDFPPKLIDLDEVSSTFWKSFQPILFSGERTVLNISYMGVSTGKITISTKEDTRLGDVDTFHINARVKTADFYSYLYEIDDYCDSYVSKTNFTPLKFSLIQRQSSQDIDDLQLFDHTKMKTYSFYKRVTKEKEKKEKKVKDIPKFFQDPLSVLYFIRGLPMITNKTYVIPLVNQGKVEVLKATFEKTEMIKTALGNKNAYRIKISTKHKGKTIEGGDMIFWFSADDRRVFLKFSAKIKIGTVSGEIESYKEI